MKTANVSRLGRRAAWTLGAALIFVQQTALACPGCKQNMTPGAGGATPPLNGASVGFGLSIFFMIFMIVAILSSLGYMMYRSCRVIAAQQREALARMEAEDDAAMPGSPAHA